MPDKTIVRLRVVSADKSPKAISGIIGMFPDASWTRGDTRPRTIIVEKNNGWELTSGLQASASLKDQCAALLERVRPYSDSIGKLAKEATVIFSCVIYSGSPPALYFSKEFLAELTNLGAAFDIDLYIEQQKSGNQ